MCNRKDARRIKKIASKIKIKIKAKKKMAIVIAS
jgi:hypothetical protein